MYEDGSLHLAEEGRKLAEGFYERHRFFTEYLMEMGVSAKQAEEDACKMEHIICKESFRALKMGLKKDRESVQKMMMYALHSPFGYNTSYIFNRNSQCT